MRILVTGGAGFIGSHLSEALLQLGHEVVIIDDFNDYYDPALKLMNLEQIRQRGPVECHRIDICEEPQVMRVLASNPPQAIVHLAARAGVRPSLDKPLLYERVNVGGTMVLLEACRRLSIPRFVFASSSSIYGTTNRVPFSEQDHLNLPVSPYAATKIAGEKICHAYAHLFGIKTVCLRFFTVYGPRQRPDLAIRKFAEAIDAGNPIPVFGDGSSGRDYTYVADTVQGILAALNYDCMWDVFNLGNSHPISLRTMIETIEVLLGRKAVIQPLPDQPGDVPITFADISKARRELGYDPKTPFRDGVERFLHWHSSALSYAGQA
ncbi:MAG: NAD-dependent epimerase/dehydratase family protein [Acidimicrobiia bacterium]|nr:NAD-dependent epimerase/dehydratase family protein [Acidimicrobiia bacterium]